MQEKMEISDAGCEQPMLVRANKKKKMNPTRLVNVIACEVQRRYRLVGDSSPPLNGTFTMVLKLNSAEYTSSELNIMTVPPATAAKAPNKTPLHENQKLRPLSPIAELNDLANKRQQRIMYHLYPQSFSPTPNLNTLSDRVLLKVGTDQFIGAGRTQKEAKSAAAVEALNHFSGLPDPESVKQQQEPSVPEINGGSIGGDIVDAQSPGTSKKIVKPKAKGVNPEAKTPASQLHEIQQARQERGPVYSVIEERGKPPCVEFTMQCTVGNVSTKGSGPNKKTAKNDAAEAMLKRIGYSGTKKTASKKSGQQDLNVYRNQGSEKKKMNATTSKSESRAESNMDFELIRENVAEISEKDLIVAPVKLNIPLVNVSGTQGDLVDFVSRFLQVVQMAADLKGPKDSVDDPKDAKREGKNQRRTQQQSSSGHSLGSGESLEMAVGDEMKRMSFDDQKEADDILKPKRNSICERSGETSLFEASERPTKRKRAKEVSNEDAINAGEDVGHRSAARMEEVSVGCLALRGACRQEPSHKSQIACKSSGEFDNLEEDNIFFRAPSSSQSTKGKGKTKERPQEVKIRDERDQGRRELGSEKEPGHPASKEVTIEEMQGEDSDLEQETDDEYASRYLN